MEAPHNGTSERAGSGAGGPGTGRGEPGTLHRPRGTGHRIPGWGDRQRGTLPQARGTGQRTPAKGDQACCIGEGVPGTGHPAPGGGHRELGIPHRIRGTGIPAPSTGHPVPGVPGSLHRAVGTRNPAQGTGHPALVTEYRVPGVHRAPGTGHPARGTGARGTAQRTGGLSLCTASPAPSGAVPLRRAGGGGSSTSSPDLSPREAAGARAPSAPAVPDLRPPPGLLRARLLPGGFFFSSSGDQERPQTPSRSPGWHRNGMGAVQGKPQRQAVEFGGKERVRVGGLQKPPAPRCSGSGDRGDGSAPSRPLPTSRLPWRTALGIL